MRQHFVKKGGRGGVVVQRLAKIKGTKKELLLAEEFAASTGTPMYVVPPVSMKQSAKQSATTMKQPKQEPVLSQL